MTIRRRAFIALALLLTFGTPAGAAERPPNIVLIVADDMGYADLGVHGSKDVLTPNIDRLAGEGVRFTDAYVSSPYCSPSRAGLLTGRYPQRFGYEFNLQPELPGHRNAGLPRDQATLAERLKAKGYRTALLGKWHLGSPAPLRPLQRGFDEFFGFLSGQHSYFRTGPESDPIYDGTVPVETMPYLTQALGDRAAAFIDREKERPFFLYLAFSAPHFPPEAPDEYLVRFPFIRDPLRRAYAAQVAVMDEAIGKTLAALRTHDLDRQTLVLFLSDNGGATMRSSGLNGSSNAPLRGSKRQTWEGGIRVPFVMRWTGRLDAGKVEQRPIVQLDVVPTALAAAGVPIAPEWKLDGVDLLPYLTEKKPGVPHDTLYWRLGGMMAIRRGEWKLVKTSEGPLRKLDPSVLSDLTGAGLYDLKTDIGETRDLAAEHPEKVRELSLAWQRWNATLAPPAWPAPQALR
jgi:arylsulfatase A-like enzyme